MCGIAGVFRLTGRPTAEDAAAVFRMMDAQVHRGPDDWGILVPTSLAADARFRSLAPVPAGDRLRSYPDAAGPGAVLGVRRLSILDRSEQGRMPMGTPDGRLWVVHNGEVYNYRDIRAELEGPGRPFSSTGDTEAILRGYGAWGDAVVDRLRGMFAFAVFQASPTARLFLARDRLGIKPVYYHRDDERLIFASEVRALLRSGLVAHEPAEEALVRFLQLGSVPVPLTTVKGVMALPAGQRLIADARGVAVRKYWDLAASVRGTDAAADPAGDDAVATTRTLLEESIQLHLVSDVPLGVFLSGGVDSSGVVALASRFRREPVQTLSIVFDEPTYSEARYARLVAERFGAAHREVTLRSHELFDALPSMFDAMDEPSVDGVNTYFVSKAAREAGLTVVLSGTGADEVFFGYRHFGRAGALGRMSALLRAVPSPARRRLLRAAAGVGTALGRGGLDRLEYLEEPSPANVYLLVRGLFAPREIQELLGLGAAELRAWGPAWRPDDTAGDGMLGAFAELEFTHYLQNQLLKDTDAMSMAHSIETRVPYLDHRLVEHVATLSPEVKLANGTPKPLLLGALGGALPREVWDRPKMGFTLPFQPWMQQRLSELRDVARASDRLDRRAVERTWARYESGRLHWSRPWALVVLSAIEATRRERERACPR